MNGDGGDQLRIAAHKNPILNHRPVLADSIVVTSDRACSDVDFAADLGIAQITQVRSFAAFADFGLLNLDEVPDSGSLPDLRVGTQMSKWADLGMVADMAF